MVRAVRPSSLRLRVSGGESAGAEFEFFAYGSADELVFGFWKT